jgi:hypothetical protein
VEPPQVHFSGPVYESLPWIYLGTGVSAVVASYFLQSIPILSLMAAVPGVLGILSGVVILLRRKDYREMRANYPQDTE